MEQSRKIECITKREKRASRRASDIRSNVRRKPISRGGGRFDVKEFNPEVLRVIARHDQFGMPIWWFHMKTFKLFRGWAFNRRGEIRV